MARAMGASGVDGQFWDSFVNISSLLRENHRILIMILAIFVQEPLIDPDEADRVSAIASRLFTKPLPRKGEGVSDDAGIAQAMR
jgi:hypothetical protein